MSLMIVKEGKEASQGVGYLPDGRFSPLRKKGKDGRPVYFVGDCDRVGSLKTVVKQAYELVQKISYGK